MSETTFPAPVTGTLHVYDPANRLVYFEQSPSSASSTSNSVVFVGGLGDGLAATPFLPPLAEALHAQGWSLIQVLTRSSYSGWGMGSVDRDVQDLRKLEEYLRRSEVKGSDAKLVLLGHSTGCQDIVRYFQMYPQNTWSAVIPQAPVSDREAWAEDLSADDIERAHAGASAQVAEGNGAYPLSPAVMNVIYPGKGGQDGQVQAVSANRWLSLASKGGHEDYFSSDLSDEIMAKAFAPLKDSGTRALFVYSEEDQHVPKYVDKGRLLERIKEYAGAKIETVLLNDANHNIGAASAQKEFAERVVQFIQTL